MQLCKLNMSRTRTRRSVIMSVLLYMNMRSGISSQESVSDKLFLGSDV